MLQCLIGGPAAFAMRCDPASDRRDATAPHVALFRGKPVVPHEQEVHGAPGLVRLIAGGDLRLRRLSPSPPSLDEPL
ncbi:protein of unknown function [Paraburkholderia kururiensis]